MEDEIEVNASMSISMDSFVPDGQQERQPGDAITRERVRNLQVIQITPVSADQNIQLDTKAVPNPNLAPAKTGHTLTLEEGDIADQAQLAFNPVAGVTSRGAGSSRGANRGALSTSVSSAPLSSLREPRVRRDGDRVYLDSPT